MKLRARRVEEAAMNVRHYTVHSSRYHHHRHRRHQQQQLSQHPRHCRHPHADHMSGLQ